MTRWEEMKAWFSRKRWQRKNRGEKWEGRNFFQDEVERDRQTTRWEKMKSWYGPKTEQPNEGQMSPRTMLDTLSRWESSRYSSLRQ